jgi:hypothetical protein
MQHPQRSRRLRAHVFSSSYPSYGQLRLGLAAGGEKLAPEHQQRRISAPHPEDTKRQKRKLD